MSLVTWRMSRRTFGHMLAGIVVASPGVVIAQVSKGVRLIGRLEPGSPDTPQELWQESEALRELGWVEGKNLQVERRYARNRPEALQALAEELVRAKVEIIVTGGAAATLAAKRATTTVPIVFRAAGDPLGSGLVTSLARPGGNITGFSLNYPDVIAKELSLLKELLPNLQRIGSLGFATQPWHTLFRGQFERACRSLDLEPLPFDVAVASEIEDAVAQLAKQRVQALVLRADSFVYEHRFELIAAAMKHSLPTMSEQISIVLEAGALVAYNMTQAEEDRRAASYIDRILRGAKPADLPVEQPTTFHLVINTKTAKALGITIPKSLLLRADKVIS